MSKLSKYASNSILYEVYLPFSISSQFSEDAILNWHKSTGVQDFYMNWGFHTSVNKTQLMDVILWLKHFVYIWQRYVEMFGIDIVKHLSNLVAKVHKVHVILQSMNLYPVHSQIKWNKSFLLLNRTADKLQIKGPFALWCQNLLVPAVEYEFLRIPKHLSIILVLDLKHLCKKSMPFV